MDDQTQQSVNKINPFSIASVVCGMLSITLCCLGILSLPFGALGILFAVLTKRLEEPLSPLSLNGIVLSGLGILLGLCVTGYALYTFATDEEYRDAVQQYYEYYNSSYFINP